MYASYARAKFRITTKSFQDLMTAHIGMRLTLRSFKHENRKVSNNCVWTAIFVVVFRDTEASGSANLHLIN